MIKYQYAKDNNGNLIDINHLNKENRDNVKFFCIGCGNELIARLGKIKIHHFSHKKEVNCSGETYLHLLGKQLFYDNYVECLKNNIPFIIEFNQKRVCNHYEQDLGVKCKLEKTVTKFDLTQYFDKILIEKREGSFIADIMLTSKSGKDKIFVEIAVTHLSTEQKLNSKYRIIEINVDSEEDFEPIKSKFLSINNSKIKFKNFKTKQINCNGNCENTYNLLTLDKEGRCLLQQLNLKQIKRLLVTDNEKIEKYEISEYDNCESYYNSITFKNAVATFAKENLKIRNCFICRYHANNETRWFEEGINGVPIFCKFLKIKCNSNKAVTCEYFRLEKNYVEEILQELHEYENEVTEYDQFYLDEENDE